jgi:ABC-type polysaccharide/polyol phosphate transport system ATPase subunit
VSGHDSAIAVSALSKKFCKSLRRGLYYGARDMLASVVKPSTGGRQLRRDEFWAVDGVSFTVGHGETLGVIGENGCGKSTLLKILNGVLLPDDGTVAMNGRVGALIEIGAGFNPLLSGRENVYLNGAILGMTRAEIERKFDSIVAFADVGEFLDVPVRNYSSGMTVRLGFAVAIHAELDTLLVDEVLAVGDALFQYKCFERIQELKARGATIVLVSHSMSAVERVCDRTLVMHHGKPVFLGETAVAIEHYFGLLSDHSRSATSAFELDMKEIRFSDVVAQAVNAPAADAILFGHDLDLSFQYRTEQYAGEEVEFRVGLKLPSGVVGSMMRFRRRALPEERITLRLSDPRLVPGTYFVNLAACPVGADVHLGGLGNATSFRIVPEESGDYRFEYGQEYMVLFDYTVNGERAS